MKAYHRIMARAATFVTLTIPSAVLAAAPTELQTDKLLPPEVAQNLGVPAQQDLRITIARLINVFMGLLGIVAVVIILIGGFMWMTAGGDEEKVGNARKLIFSGIIGLAIILSAFAIARFVISSLLEATTAS